MGGPTYDIPPAPPAPPPSSPVEQSILDARRREKKRQMAMGGRASTLLTGPGGEAGAPKLGTPTLLGSTGA